MRFCGLVCLLLVGHVQSFMTSISSPPATWRKTVANMPGFMNETYFPHEDITFSYYGNHHADPAKPTALFLSGLEFSALSLAQYANDVADDYNLVYMCSGSKGVQTDIHDLVRVMNEYIETKTLQDVMLVGESAGAVIALNYALSFPDKVKSIVVLNSATAYPRAAQTIQIIDFLRDLPDVCYYLAIVLFVSQQKQDMTGLRWNDMGLMVQMLVNLLLFPKKDLIHRVDSWIIKGCLELEDRIHEITCPVNAVSSTNDQMFPSIQEANLLSTLIPSCNVVVVPRCDHLILRSHFNIRKVMDLE